MATLSLALVLCFLFSFFSLSASSSNYGVGWGLVTESNSILEADFDTLSVKHLFDVEFQYTSDFGSAYDEAHNIIFLTAETSKNSNQFGFFSVDINSSTVKQHNLPADVLPEQTSLRWISSTPDVVYIFSWKAAVTYNFAEDSFQEFLNFSTVFSAIPSNSQAPDPFYFDTNANILYSYFVYDNQNNQVEMARIGVTMEGEVVEKQSISCIPGMIPYFDPSTNSTYSILRLSGPLQSNYIQTITHNATCSESKTVFSSPSQNECYLWDGANNRMLLANFGYGPEMCKYTNNEWTMDCKPALYQLEAIFPSSS